MESEFDMVVETEFDLVVEMERFHKESYRNTKVDYHSNNFESRYTETS